MRIWLLPLLLTGCVASHQLPPPLPEQQGLMDGDRDGVIDARDRCPDSAPGVLVDNDGCPHQKGMEYDFALNVGFANDSSKLGAESKSGMQLIAEHLRRNPDAQISLSGHASAPGGGAHNQALSEARAIAVRDALIRDYGIAPERISLAAYGANKLLVEGEGEEVDRFNRRVEGTADPFLHEADVLRWTIYTPGQDRH
jgi:OmpA-OmpF porin, OOP family